MPTLTSSQMRDLLNDVPLESHLRSYLEQPETMERFRVILQRRIDHFLENGLAEALPGLAMFIDEPLIEEFKQAMEGEISRQLPGMMNDFSDQMPWSSLSEHMQIHVPVSSILKWYRWQLLTAVILLIAAGIIIGMTV